MHLYQRIPFWALTFVALFVTVGANAAAAVDNPRPFVVPELTSWQGARGDFHPTGRIVVTDRAFLPVAERFAADYAELFSRRLTVVQGKGRAGDLVLSRTDRRDTLGAEGYRLTVGETATITAATAQGAFWGTRTILQISEQTRSHALPAGVATDRPAYPVRGFMIDVGRKYIPMDYLRQLVKVMAYYKMNTLQVHLNDNGFKQYFGNDWAKTPAAFRLESDFFPGLTARDGSYTKKEFRAFQREAAVQGVEILPEIDVPAHSLAFTHYRPSLGSEEFGADHLNLRNPRRRSFPRQPLHGRIVPAPIPYLSARACISEQTNTATRTKPWSNSSVRSPTTSFATSNAMANRPSLGVPSRMPTAIRPSRART